jgi:RNA 2',3'-cyclic 3'-phosphodiesterase
VRLFVAAYPPPRVRDDLDALVRRLAVGQPRERGHSVRLAPAEQWHVTFAFLGEVPDASLDKARSALDRAVVRWRYAAIKEAGAKEAGAKEAGAKEAGAKEAGAKEAGAGKAAAEETAAPVVRIAGGGTFGRDRFTTLWAGLHGDVDALSGVAAALRRELRAARLPRDDKRFRPHVTIARPGDRLSAEELAADLSALRAYEGPVWTVDSMWLVRSHLGPRPTYNLMHETALVL